MLILDSTTAVFRHCQIRQECGYYQSYYKTKIICLLALFLLPYATAESEIALPQITQTNYFATNVAALVLELKNRNERRLYDIVYGLY